MKIEFNKETWRSKLLALIIFLALPFWGLYLFTKYIEAKIEILQANFLVTKNQTTELYQSPTLDSTNKLNEIVKIGDKLGKMTVFDVKPYNPEAGEISIENIKVLLYGPITVTGKYKHESSAIGFDGYCMSNFDKASLKILPSLPGEKTPLSYWFCFRNYEIAKKLLGETERIVSVTINNYELNSYPSEVVDWADITYSKADTQDLTSFSTAEKDRMFESARKFVTENSVPEIKFDLIFDWKKGNWVHFSVVPKNVETDNAQLFMEKVNGEWQLQGFGTAFPDLYEQHPELF